MSTKDDIECMLLKDEARAKAKDILEGKSEEFKAGFDTGRELTSSYIIELINHIFKYKEQE